MSTNRISLSSSVFDGRIKKFDAYQHNPRTSRRVTKKTSPNTKSNKTHRAQKLTTKVPIPKPIPVQKVSARKPVVSTPVHRTRKTHQLALQAVGSTRPNSSVIESQFNNFAPPTKTKRSKLHTTMYVAAIIVFIFASTVSAQTFISNLQTKQQIEDVLGENTTVDEQGVVQGTGNTPAEDQISSAAVSNYQITNPEEPRYLRVPSLGIDARIKSLGVKDGAVDAPANINDVGWYNGSTRPGNSRGSSLLLGHVSGWTKDGVFKYITNLKPGTQFEVEKGSGEKIRYEVIRSEDIPLAEIDMQKILGTEVAGEHDLKLMTCAGKYNRDTETFDDRTVVYAKVLS